MPSIFFIEQQGALCILSQLQEIIPTAEINLSVQHLH
ncbi:MAG: hypothetical protein ACI9TB_000964 [Parasphingorhabdus sp.]|jgi:hypothetical protein